MTCKTFYGYCYNVSVRLSDIFNFCFLYALPAFGAMKQLVSKQTTNQKLWRRYRPPPLLKYLAKKKNLETNLVNLLFSQQKKKKLSPPAKRHIILIIIAFFTKRANGAVVMTNCSDTFLSIKIRRGGGDAYIFFLKHI